MIQDKARKAPHPAAYEKASKRRPSPRPNPYAVCQVVTQNGNKAVLVNGAKPDGYNLARNTCRHCRLIEYKSGISMPVAYAHTRNTRGHCDECEGDRIAALGIALERQGINLGWGYHSTASQSNEYVREAQGFTSDVSTLSQDAREV